MDPNNIPTRKPKKNPACIQCRKRKIGCDRGHPKCGNCIKLKRAQCIYPDEFHTASELLREMEKASPLQTLSPASRNINPNKPTLVNGNHVYIQTPGNTPSNTDQNKLQMLLGTTSMDGPVVTTDSITSYSMPPPSTVISAPRKVVKSHTGKNSMYTSYIPQMANIATLENVIQFNTQVHLLRGKRKQLEAFKKCETSMHPELKEKIKYDSIITKFTQQEALDMEMNYLKEKLIDMQKIQKNLFLYNPKLKIKMKAKEQKNDDAHEDQEKVIESIEDDLFNKQEVNLFLFSIQPVQSQQLFLRDKIDSIFSINFLAKRDEYLTDFYNDLESMIINKFQNNLNELKQSLNQKRISPNIVPLSSTQSNNPNFSIWWEETLNTLEDPNLKNILELNDDRKKLYEAILIGTGNDDTAWDITTLAELSVLLLILIQITKLDGKQLPTSLEGMIPKLENNVAAIILKLRNSINPKFSIMRFVRQWKYYYRLQSALLQNGNEIEDRDEDLYLVSLMGEEDNTSLLVKKVISDNVERHLIRGEMPMIPPILQQDLHLITLIEELKNGISLTALTTLLEKFNKNDPIELNGLLFTQYFLLIHIETLGYMQHFETCVSDLLDSIQLCLDVVLPKLSQFPSSVDIYSLILLNNLPFIILGLFQRYKLIRRPHTQIWVSLFNKLAFG